MATLAMHPEHRILVTRVHPFGRVWIDCSCGLTRVCAGMWAAERLALIHHHEHAGCNCPPEVVASDVHPSPAPDAPSPVSGSVAARSVADASTGGSIHCNAN